MKIRLHRHRHRLSSLASAVHGFAYLWVLLAIALIGIGLVAASEVWVTAARRERAEELDWIGDQFVNAIGSYYFSTIGASRAYPESLEQLLEDRRFVTVRRHLRAIYRNPHTGNADWEVLRASNGRIVGVRARWHTEGGDLSKDFTVQGSGGP